MTGGRLQAHNNLHVKDAPAIIDMAASQPARCPCRHLCGGLLQTPQALQLLPELLVDQPVHFLIHLPNCIHSLTGAMMGRKRAKTSGPLAPCWDLRREVRGTLLIFIADKEALVINELIGYFSLVVPEG
jgi:hypothetical protein